MKNLIDDLSTVTTIPKQSIADLVNLSVDCLTDYVVNAQYENDPVVSVDIGIGTLQLKQQDNAISYRFIPSSDLEDTLCKYIGTRQSPLIQRAEKALKEKILSAYKKLL